MTTEVIVEVRQNCFGSSHEISEARSPSFKFLDGISIVVLWTRTITVPANV